MRAARLRADRAGVLHHPDARHGPDGVTAHRTTLLALAAAVAAAPLPAWAMCDMRVIETRSIEDSAAYIRSSAETLGIGYATTIDHAAPTQQNFQLVLLPQGEGSRCDLLPSGIT